MRCPRCLDEYEPDVATCATCGDALVPADAPLPAQVDALLGRFHRLVAERLEGMLEHRAIAHRVVVRDDDVEVYVDRDHRADLRAELATNWPQVVRSLPEEDAVEVLGLGGAAPGWFDAPRGGWVDRAGRLVVEADEDSETDARLAGPAIATIGGLLLLLGWYTGAGEGVVYAGAGMLLLGLFLPR